MARRTSSQHAVGVVAFSYDVHLVSEDFTVRLVVGYRRDRPTCPVTHLIVPSVRGGRRLE